ncbi:MAG TPA: ABC transporter permease [Candidatus Cybelea sp.]|nr:ABC transporter permease [Candidatus Cybelea sp.]
MSWIERLFLRRKLYRELSDEIGSHLEERTEELVRSGVAKEDAAAEARREFGNVLLIKERGREVWQWPAIESLFADVRFGARVLRKSPGFAAVAVLTLTLAIGANTAIFSLINAVALRSLPVPDPQQLVVLEWKARQGPSTNSSYNFGGCHRSTDVDSGCSFSYPMFDEFRARQTVFSGICAFVSRPIDIVLDGHANQLNGAFVSGDFFSTLGTRAAIGRTLDARDDAPGAQPVIVLGYAYWRDELSGDPNIIGKTAAVNRRAVRIVGVGQAGFQLDPGIPMDFWLPLASQPQIDPILPKRTAANSLWLMLMARLRPGMKAERAVAALNTIFVPSTASGPNPIFKPEDAPQIALPSATAGLSTLRDDFSVPLFLLMTAVGLILLIACANVAGLMLARSSARQKEMAVRKALGARQLRLARQLLTESVLLSLTSGLLGILLAVAATRSLARFFSTNWFRPLQLDVTMDRHVLAFTLAVSVAVGILFGLAPALRGSGADVTASLNQGTFQSGRFGKRSLVLNNVLVVAQVAVSMVVLDGAALLVRTLANLKTTDPGFVTRNVLVFTVDMSLGGYGASSDYKIEREIQSRLASLPGVNSATYSALALLSGANITSQFNLPGRPWRLAVTADELPVGPDFFETLRIPLLAGRTFQDADFESSAKPEPAVINRLFAQTLFEGQNPLGRGISEAYAEKPEWRVIGVVPGTKYESLRDETTPTIYTLHRDEGAVFEVRTSGDPRPLIPFLRDSIRQIDPNLLVMNIKTESEQIDQTLYQERLLAVLSSLFGILAIILVSIGLYGLVAYGVVQRTHEIGVRIAVGAQPGRILALMARQGLALTATGIILGLGAAAAVTRYLETLLYGVRPADPWAFATISALLGSVALVACCIPARRGTRVDPIIALKYE